MGYRCQKCHKAQPAHTSQNSLVIKSREKTYLGENQEVVGQGRETVREIKVCKKCYDNATKPKVE